MKTKKPIYSIALFIAITLVLIAFYIFNQGEFIIDTEKDEWDDRAPGENAYAIFPVKWTGYGEPVIKVVSLRDKTNQNISQFMLQNELVTGTAIATGELSPHYFYVIVKTDELDHDIQHITMEIQYRSFGVSRKQNLLPVQGV